MNQEILDNLVTAVSNGRTDIVRSLLVACQKGAAETNGSVVSISKVLSEQCSSVGTLLHLATKLDHVDIVRTLLAAEANPNSENSVGETSVDLVQSERMTSVFVDELLKCSAKSEMDHIHNLINAGVDINSLDSPETKNTPLHWAVCFGKPEAVECLLELGGSPNRINGVGVTPLHEAMNRKNLDIIRMLLCAGGNPFLKCPSGGVYAGKSPMDMTNGNKEIESVLDEYAVKDSGSEMSDNMTGCEDNGTDQSQRENLESLNESLQSLSTSSEPAKPQPFSPQTVHVPPFLSTPLPLITDSKLHLLWPQPQKIVQTDGESFKLIPKLSVYIILGSTDFSALSVMEAWSIHEEKFRLQGNECIIENICNSVSERSGDIICHLNPALFSRMDSYKIVVNKDQIRILSSDVAGLHYALCTLEQLFSLYHEDDSLPPLFIHDWPDLAHRAVLLDFSIGARKPTLDTLKGYIKIMSSLKMKQLHCYFRYESNSWNGTPFPNKDFIELSKFASQYFINLIPAIDVGISEKHINVKECITEPAHHLMSLLSSKSIQLGPNLSKILSQEIVNSRNARIVWDMLLLPISTTIYLYYSSNPLNSDWLNFLPLNCVLIDYGYQLEHDYELNTKAVTHSGGHVVIATGTTSWGSIAGVPESAISIIHKGATAATLHSTFGLIVADWQTLPHHPAFCFSWPDIVLSLGMAWNSSVHEDYLHIRLPELLNLYVYQDSAQITGYLNIELGRLEGFMHQSIYQSHKDSTLCPPSCKGSAIHQLLVDPDSVILDNFTAELLQQVIRHVKKFELELQKATPLCYQHGELVLELRLAMDLLQFACKLGKTLVSTGANPNSLSCGLAVINVGVTNLPPIARTDLANKLLALIEQFRAVWLSRNLPCGLQTSLAIFNSLLMKLIPESDETLLDIDRGGLVCQEPYFSPNGAPRNSI